MYCAALFLKRTSIPLNQNVLNKVMTFAAIISLGNLLFDIRMSLKQWIFFGVIATLLVLDSLPTGNHEILYLFIVIWGCRNIDKKRIIRYIFGIIAILTLVIALFVMIGVIENTQFLLNGVRERKGLGYNVWSILPFQFYSLCVFYMYIQKKKIRIYKVILMNVLALYIGIVTDTKTSVIMTFSSTFLIYWIQTMRIRNWKRLRWLIVLPEMLAISSYLITCLYGQGGAFWKKINTLLSNRLMYQSTALNRYGITLFANPSVKSILSPESYFGIDNQYMNLAVTWGIIALVVVLLVYSYLIKYCIENKDLKLLVIILSMLFMSMIWSRLVVLIEAVYLVCFSDVFANKKSRNRKATSNKYGDGSGEKNTYIC